MEKGRDVHGVYRYASTHAQSRQGLECLSMQAVLLTRLLLELGMHAMTISCQCQHLRELHGMIGLMAGMHLRQDLVWVRTTCLAQGPRYVLQITTVQHKQMFVPHQQLPSPNMGMLDSGQQFATAPPGGFLGSKRASAMQQAVSR